MRRTEKRRVVFEANIPVRTGPSFPGDWYDMEDEMEFLRDRVLRLERNQKLSGFGQIVLGVLLCLVIVALAAKANADEPYLEAWATKTQTFTGLPGSDTWFVHKGGWGGEVIGRIPLLDYKGEVVDRSGPLLSVFGRAVTDGASGSFVFNNPASWSRLVLEGGMGWRVWERERYSLQVFAGYGWAYILQRADDQEGPVPDRYGGGVHIRDEKLRMWAQVRAEWDATVGPGPHLAASIHVPLLSERTALGADAVFPFGEGELPRFTVKLMARLWSK